MYIRSGVAAAVQVLAVRAATTANAAVSSTGAASPTRHRCCRCCCYGCAPAVVTWRYLSSVSLKNDDDAVLRKADWYLTRAAVGVAR